MGKELDQWLELWSVPLLGLELALKLDVALAPMWLLQGLVSWLVTPTVNELALQLGSEKGQQMALVLGSALENELVHV
jgi:hypothetical protein